MSWFKRNKQNIVTTTEEKKDSLVGLWYKTPTGEVIDTEQLEKNLYVSPEDDFHVRIGSKEYFSILFDEGKFRELDEKVESVDPLGFKDTKDYPSRVKEAQLKTGLKDAVRNAVGKIEGKYIVISCMDFSFIGGSLGSVMGEKISRAIDYAIRKDYPMMIISQSGGARMMEAAFSLMQMAKTSSKISSTWRKKITIY